MILKIEDLILRTVSIDDIYEVARMWDFEKSEISQQEAKKAIEQMAKNHMKNAQENIYHICFAIFEASNEKIIGWCGLDGKANYGTQNHKVYIFYLIDAEYRRKGYATLCAKRLLELGFRTMKANRIDGSCAKDNIGSRKVLEKIGMRNKTFSDDGAPQYYLTNKEYIDLFDNMKPL